MSFTNQSGVMLLIEELLSFVWPLHLGKIKTPFPRLTYEDAMLTYGTDKPDIGCSTKVIIYSTIKFFLNYHLFLMNFFTSDI